MAYKRTGRPPGRPRKHPLPEAASVEPAPAVPRKFTRLRASYRENADRENPNPAVVVYDSRGRPRERKPHHAWIGACRP